MHSEILHRARRAVKAVAIKIAPSLAFVLLVVVPGQSVAQEAYLAPCKDQLAMWQADSSLKDKIKGWYCPDPNARTMPIPPPGGQPAAGGGGGVPMGLPTTEGEAMVTVMGWLLQGLMSGGSSADGQQQQQQALLQQKQAEEKFKAEMLQKERAFQAREARALWERQDADRSQELGSLFGPSTGQTGGMSPLLQKQAALAAAAPSNSASDEGLRHRAEDDLGLEQAEFENMNARWVQRQKHLIEQRLQEPNPYADKIYRSLKTTAPPPPTEKNYDNLQPGDVLLFSHDDTKSLLTNLGDRISSASGSPAAHTVLYLKEVNGKKLFLDNLPGKGSHVISEEEFLKTYGRRGAHLASVAQPLTPGEADKLWNAAKERIKQESGAQQQKAGHIVDQTGYGLYGDDNMVCSETSRWALIKAGRNIPESGSPIKKFLGIDYGPANFYSDDYNFIITPLWADPNR